MKPALREQTDRVTRSRKSTPLRQDLIVLNSPHHRNLRTRSLKIEMDAEAKETPEEEPTQDSLESVPKTPTRSTRRSLVSNKSVGRPKSVEKQISRKTKSLSTALSIQDTIAEDAKTESSTGEDQNSDPLNNEENPETHVQKTKRKRSSLKDLDDESDSMSNTKSNLDASSTGEQSVDSKIPVLRTSKRLFASKDASSEDQPITRVTRRTRRSCSISEVPEIKSEKATAITDTEEPKALTRSLGKVSEMETEPSEEKKVVEEIESFTKVGAEEELTKSEEMQSTLGTEKKKSKSQRQDIESPVELVLAQSIETKDNSSGSLAEETKKSPIFKKSSVLHSLTETDENCGVAARHNRKKSPKAERKSLDTLEAVPETEAETNKETVLDGLEAVPEIEENCGVAARLNRKKSRKNKSLDTTEVVPETEFKTNEETALDENTKLDIQNSSLRNLPKEMDQQSVEVSEKSQSVNPDLSKLGDIGEKEIKDFISVCRHETEKESSLEKGIAKELDMPAAFVLLGRTDKIMESVPAEEMVNDEKDDLILLLDESNDSVEIPKKKMSKSLQKNEKFTDLTIIPSTFEEISVFDTPQSSPEEAVSSKTSQKTDKVSETPTTVPKETLGSQKTPKSAEKVGGNSDGEEVKPKKTQKTPNKEAESSKIEDTVSKLETPKTFLKESQKPPKSAKEVRGNSDEEDAKPKKTPKKAEAISDGEDAKPKKTPKKAEGISDREDAKPKKTPKKAEAISDGEDAKPKKTPKKVEGISDGEDAKSKKTPKKAEGIHDGEDAKPKKTPKKAEAIFEVEDAKPKKTPKKAEAIFEVEDAKSKTPKKAEGISDGEDAKPKKTPKKAEAISDGEDAKPKKTPKKAEGIFEVEDAKSKTPKKAEGISDGEDAKPKKTPKKAEAISEEDAKSKTPKKVEGIHDGENAKPKKTPKKAEAISEEEDAKPKKTPKKAEAIFEVEDAKPKTPKKVEGISDGEDAKSKTPKKAEGIFEVEDAKSKTPKKVEGISDGEDAKPKKTPKKAEAISDGEDAKSKKTPKKAEGISDGEDAKPKKTPKKAEGISDEEDTKPKKTPKTKPTKTPKSGKDIGESLNPEETKPSKTPKSAECSEVEETKRTKTPKDVQDKKLTQTPKSGKDITECSEVQDTKLAKTPKSAKKNGEKIHEVQDLKLSETSKSRKAESEGSSGVEETKLPKMPKPGKKDIKESSKVEETKLTVKDAEESPDVEKMKLTKAPESEKNKNVEDAKPKTPKRKKHKKKSKSKEQCGESSEIEELQLAKTPKSAKKDGESFKAEETVRTKTPKSAKKSSEESSVDEQTKIPKSVKKSGVESSAAGETIRTKTPKALKRKVAESFEMETKSDEARISAKSDSGESSGVEDSKSKKARKSTKDSLESCAVEIKPPKTPKSGKKKVFGSSESEETKHPHQSENAEMSNGDVVVVNMHPAGWESSSFKEMKSSKEAKDSLVISKVKSPESVFTEESLKKMVNKIVSPMLENLRMFGKQNLLDVDNAAESAISYLPISKTHLNEETSPLIQWINKLQKESQTVRKVEVTPKISLKKSKKAAVKKDLKEFLELQDNVMDDLKLKKLMKKLKKKSLKTCEVQDKPEVNRELMKLMKKLKKKSLKISEVEETEENPKEKIKKKKIPEVPVIIESTENEKNEKKMLIQEIPEVIDMSVRKKRKAKKSSAAKEKKMKLEIGTVEVKTPGVIITSSIPSSVDRIDIQQLFLKKEIKLLSMRKSKHKTELCIENVDNLGEAMSLLSSKYFGKSVRIDTYHTSPKTDSVTDDDGFRFCQVYVNQIPPHATDSDLMSLFPKATSCELPQKKSGRNHGFCFLTFPDKPTAQEHLVLNGKVNFAGYRLGIHSTQKECSQSIYGHLLKEMLVDVTDLDELLILEDLPSRLNKTNLANLFPSVLNINLKLGSQLKDRPSCAIVVCKNANQAKMFLQKDIEWDGHKLIVKKATEKLLNFVMNQNKLNEDELAVYDGRLLKVTNLPQKTKIREIEELFPSSVLIKLFAKHQFAVVAFSTIKETDQISKNQTDQLTLRGKDVEIKPFKLLAPSKKLTDTKNPKKLLHVRGFPKTTTVEELGAVFNGCKVVLTKTGNTPYAIVKCGTVEKAKHYLAKKKLVVRGKILKIRRLLGVLEQMKQEAELADK